MKAMMTGPTVSSPGELTISTHQRTIASGHATPQPANDFSAMLGRLAGETAQTLRQGEAAAISGMTGGIALQTMVERVMAAERTLQSAIAIRDKAVSAYLEISRMQI